MKNSKRLLALAVSAALAAPMAAYATNGMNLEGYGPIATGAGGTSMAYDNGTAAMMNNPATLGLGGEGQRLDVAVGVLGPDITTNMTGMPGAESDSTSFLMPAVGYTKSDGQLTYGVGMFAQGGMGTKYAGTTFMSGGTGLDNFSELGVARLLFPVAYQVNDQLIVGGSIDYVSAGLDLRMLMPGSAMMDMMPGSTNYMGTMSGTLVDTMGSFMMMGALTGLNYGYFDFADGSDTKGAASGDGFAGKIGMTFKVNNKLTVGATYHTQTSLSDLESNSQNATFNVMLDDNVLNGTFMTAGLAGTSSAANITMNGDIAVVDFQWPSSLGLGVAYQATDALRLTADVKRVGWSDTMDTFKVKFTPSSVQADPLAQMFVSMGGTVLDVSMNQKWDDQTVVAVGAAYDVNNQLTVRAGYNHGSNPIPSDYLNPLFPATVESHITLGMGYQVNNASSVDVSVVRASEYSSDITMMGMPTGMSVSHEQTNFQLMYSYKF